MTDPKGASSALGAPALGAVASAPPRVRGPGLVRRLILNLDESLRRERGVMEFVGGSGILRVAVIASDVDAVLPSGLVVKVGDPVIEVHFANERLPQASNGAGIGFGARLGRALLAGLAELAIGVEIDPRLRDAKAIIARLAFAGERNRGDTRRFAHRLGFETTDAPTRVPLARQFHDFGEDLWLVGLTWVFNRGSLKGRSVLRLREDMWMSRAQLIAHHGKACGKPRAA